jgi:hypothetical protein
LVIHKNKNTIPYNTEHAPIEKKRILPSPKDRHFQTLQDNSKEQKLQNPARLKQKIGLIKTK